MMRERHSELFGCATSAASRDKLLWVRGLCAWLSASAWRVSPLAWKGKPLMSFISRLMSWLMHLPPAHTHDLVITRDLTIPMPDGVVLLADHYAPRSGRPLPTLLVRSPYGRRGLFSALNALPYAERGYQVLMQSCRGTAGSGGSFSTLVMSTTMAWLPSPGSSNRTGFRASWLPLVPVTLGLSSGPWPPPPGQN